MNIYEGLINIIFKLKMPPKKAKKTKKQIEEEKSIALTVDWHNYRETWRREENPRGAREKETRWRR